MTTAEKIYTVVAQIPKGNVATYGMVAKLAGIKSPRVVGNILHKNPDPVSIPCHRVVNVKGNVAKSYAFGGELAHIAKLRQEGIEVCDGKVNLSVYLWKRLVKTSR